MSTVLNILAKVKTTQQLSGYFGRFAHFVWNVLHRVGTVEAFRGLTKCDLNFFLRGELKSDFENSCGFV